MLVFGDLRNGPFIHRKSFNIPTPAVICGLIVSIVGNGIGVHINSNQRDIIICLIVGIMNQVSDFYDGGSIWFHLEGLYVLPPTCLGIVSSIGQYVGIGINL